MKQGDDVVAFESRVDGGVETAIDPEQPATGGSEDMPTSKSSKSPAFQFYPRDFLSSSKVDAMSMTERGVYITLLSRCWLDHGLPTDFERLAKMVRLKRAQFERMWTSGTLRECFYVKGEKFQHDRLERERKIQADFRKSKQDAADVRWNKHRASTVDASHEQRNAPLPRSLPQSSSASATRERERPATLIQKRRLDAAWEGARVYVPNRKHSDFIALRNHDGAERELFTWYAEVDEAWARGARKDDSPGGDMLRFWTARYDEQWPAVSATRVTDTRPQWAKDAAARKAANGGAA